MNTDWTDHERAIGRVTERGRFIRAFRTELEENPQVPPGPAALARRMGLKNTRNLPGRLVHIRTHMLKEAGFVKDDRDGRWLPPRVVGPTLLEEIF